jgi:hypothetical protein
MLIWLVAILLLGGVGLAGYYAGGIRAAVTFVGLLAASLLALPLAALARPVLAIFDVKHPILVSWLSPIIVWIFLVAVFRSGAEAVHRQIHTYYKYKVADDERERWEWLNQRLGLCVGVLNGAVYLFALSTLLYALGYFTVQAGSGDRDPAPLRLVNRLALSLQQSGLARAVAGFVPKSPVYYDAADIIGTLHHNPLAQSRLSSYPAFLGLMERPEFKTLSTDQTFQEFWLKQPSLRELLRHERVKPLVENAANYSDVLQLLGGDLQDLKAYVETGRSARYEGMKIVGRWEFDFRRSFNLARRAKPNMSPAESARLRRMLTTDYASASLTIMPDNRLLFKATSTNNTPVSAAGRWSETGGGNYQLTLGEGGRAAEVTATIEAGRLQYTRDGVTVVYLK